MDERSQKLVARGIVMTMALLYLYLLVSCIWKYVITKDITNSTWELILIVMIPLSIAWFARKDETLLIPKMTLTGQEVPTESDEKTMKTRKRYYFWDSLSLATVFSILTITDSLFIQKSWDYFILFPEWNDKTNIISGLFLEFIISVVVFYAIAFVWGEWKLKRYNRILNELEDNDE